VGIAALYARDQVFLDGLALTLLELEDVDGRARQLVRWTFFVEEDGLPCESEVPDVLASLRSAFRRRTEKHLEADEMNDAVGAVADLAKLLDESDEQPLSMSFCLGPCPDHTEFEEMMETRFNPEFPVFFRVISQRLDLHCLQQF
jgi:hypothetical protein